MDAIQDLCAVKSAPGLLNCLPVLRQNHLTQVSLHRCRARVFDSRFILGQELIIFVKMSFVRSSAKVNAMNDNLMAEKITIRC